MLQSWLESLEDMIYYFVTVKALLWFFSFQPESNEH